jgi:hypothetical protein
MGRKKGKIMPIISIFDNQYIQMSYDPESRIIRHHYYPQLNSYYLRAGLDRGVGIMNDYGATKWLSDNRETNAHSPEDTEWINNDWLPRAVKAGWKFWALVVPETVVAQMNMVEFVQAFYDQGVRVMVFTDPDEAQRWLEKAG